MIDSILKMKFLLILLLAEMGSRTIDDLRLIRHMRSAWTR